MTVRARIATKVPARIIGDGVCEVFYENGVYRLLVPSVDSEDFPVFTLSAKGVVPPPHEDNTNKFLATDGIWREAVAGGEPLVDDAVNPEHLNVEVGGVPDPTKLLAFRDRLNFVSRDGDTISGGLKITASGNPTLYIDKEAVTDTAALLIQTAGQLRWLWQFSPGSPGGEAPFRLYACTDGGTPQSLPAIDISRATSLMTIQGPPVAAGHAANKEYVDAREAAANAYADANKVAKTGDLIAGPLHVFSTSGQQLTVTSWASVYATGGGVAGFASNVYYNHPTSQYKIINTTTIGWASLNVQNGALSFFGASGSVTAGAVVVPGTAKFSVDASGNLSAIGNITAGGDVIGDNITLLRDELEALRARVATLEGA